MKGAIFSQQSEKNNNFAYDVGLFAAERKFFLKVLAAEVAGLYRYLRWIREHFVE